jgi:hypothetical protein
VVKFLSEASYLESANLIRYFEGLHRTGRCARDVEEHFYNTLYRVFQKELYNFESE